MSCIVVSTEGDHGWDLDQTNLKSVSGSDLHGKSDVTIDGERHGVHELGGVWDQSEESDSEELFVDSRSIQDDVYHVYQDLGDDGVENCATEKD